MSLKSNRVEHSAVSRVTACVTIFAILTCSTLNVSTAIQLRPAADNKSYAVVDSSVTSDGLSPVIIAPHRAHRFRNQRSATEDIGSYVSSAIRPRVAGNDPPTIDSVDTSKRENRFKRSATEATDSPTTTALPNDEGMNSSCRLEINDSLFKVKVKDQISSLKLVEFRLSLLNDTRNIFETGFSNLHKANRWSRATPFGQTLLSLAFNYGILSLMTLTVGTNVTNVELRDRPLGCFSDIDSAEERLLMLRNLMIEEFLENVEKKNQFLICYEEIEVQKGLMNMDFAVFVDRCCKLDPFDGRVQCGPTYPNHWMAILYSLLHLSRIAIILFGPLLFISPIIGLARDEFPYIVKLKEALPKKIWISDNSIGIKIPKHKRCLDFRSKTGLRRLAKSISTFCAEEKNREPVCGRTLICQIPEYNILVNYKRLLTENSVPVGLWKSIIGAVFFCKLRDVPPFLACCEEDMFKECSCVNKSVRWISLCSKIGTFLFFVVLLPLPYYLRLTILYTFEYDEVLSRKDAARRLGLYESFENSFCHYFLPTHPLFVCMYVVYLMSGALMMTSDRLEEESVFRRTAIGAFTGLKNLSYVSVIEMAASNLIWPFKRYGLWGVFVCLVYWPVVIPLTAVVCCCYFLPTVYLTIRLCYDTPNTRKKSYRIKTQEDQSLKRFTVEDIFDNDHESEGKEENQNSFFKKKVKKQTSLLAADEIDRYEVLVKKNPSTSLKNRSLSSDTNSGNDIGDNIAKLASTGFFRTARSYCSSAATWLFCVLGLYSVLVLMSECLGCLLDILVFTMMGMIVNANTMLKYVALVLIIVVYSFDAFNNVEKRYLKLNKALFSEVKSRIKDLYNVTCLPSHLQENRAFKSEEQSEQGDHESPDDIEEKLHRHWLINDLILFVDNEDMPRIPCKLFDDVCKITVAGVPGPVYLGLLDGLKQFAKILVFIVFIFIVVLSFGNAYSMNETNQMLAALAGGSLPFILRTFMEPDKPDIEIGSVSFKSKLDETIKNFSQLWPVYDFVFEAYKPAAEDENTVTVRAVEQTRSFNAELQSTQAFVTEGGSMEDLSPRNKSSAFVIEPTPMHQTVSMTTSNQCKVKFELSIEQEDVDYLILLPDNFVEKLTKSPVSVV